MATTDSSSQAQPHATPEEPTPLGKLFDAIDADSVSQLSAAFDLSRSSPHAAQDRAEFPLRAAYFVAESGSPTLTEYILQVENVPLTDITPPLVGFKASVELLEVLVAHGWDINQINTRIPVDDGYRIRMIDYATHDEILVRWLLDHGARADGAELDYLEHDKRWPQPAPLLEICARHGTLASFKLLLQHGAEFGNRTLHRAAARAAAFGADPSSSAGASDANGDVEDQASTKELKRRSRNRRDSKEILRYLVDEVGLDVNGVDTTLPDRYFHYGTPINYAARNADGAAVVRWLLEKGADPYIKGPDCSLGAEGAARQEKCEAVLQTLKEWQEKQKEEKNTCLAGLENP